MLSLPDASISPAQKIASSRTHAATQASSSAQEFESILLGQWLQSAESSFGSAPGGEDDADAGGEQIQGFGVQHLASQLAGSGGIGIARIVQDALTRGAGASPAMNDSSLHQHGKANSEWMNEFRSGR